MAAEKGSAFLLKVGNGATPVVYRDGGGAADDAAQHQRRGGGDHLARNSGGWRELLSGAGVRSVSVSGAGVFTGSAAETRVKANALAGRDRRLPAELRERRDA